MSFPVISVPPLISLLPLCHSTHFTFSSILAVSNSISHHVLRPMKTLPKTVDCSRHYDLVFLTGLLEQRIERSFGDNHSLNLSARIFFSHLSISSRSYWLLGQISPIGDDNASCHIARRTGRQKKDCSHNFGSLAKPPERDLFHQPGISLF